MPPAAAALSCPTTEYTAPFTPSSFTPMSNALQGRWQIFLALPCRDCHPALQCPPTTSSVLGVPASFRSPPRLPNNLSNQTVTTSLLCRTSHAFRSELEVPTQGCRALPAPLPSSRSHAGPCSSSLGLRGAACFYFLPALGLCICCSFCWEALPAGPWLAGPTATSHPQPHCWGPGLLLRACLAPSLEHPLLSSSELP